jgi:ferric iron reductase protein FhuF
VTSPVAPGPGFVAAGGAEITAAIERAGADNPLLGFGTGTGLPAQHLCTPAATAAPAARHLIDAVARWLGHPERRVAASLVVLGYAARLVGPTLAVLLRDGLLIDARPDQVRYLYSPQRGFTLTMPDPAGWQAAPDVQVPAWCAGVLDGHLRPLIRAVRADTAVATGLLWGNVASGITGALRALADQAAVPLDRCHQTGLAVLAYASLRGSGALAVHSGRLRFRRRSCCLYYRLDGAGTCGDCPLQPC